MSPSQGMWRLWQTMPGMHLGPLTYGEIKELQIANDEDNH